MDNCVVSQEIVNEVLSHLGNDTKTASACSLVCHSWTHESRLHLFRAVKINVASISPSQGPHSCQSILSVLLDSPYILDYVCELAVIGARGLQLEVRLARWKADYPALCSILSLFTFKAKVTSVMIRLPGFTVDDLPSLVRLSFGKLLGRSSVSTVGLEFSDMSYEGSVFMKHPQWRHLAIHGLSYGTPHLPHSDIPPETERSHLISLTLVGPPWMGLHFSDYVHYFTSPQAYFQCDQLRHLQVRLHNSFSNRLWEFVSGTLRDLRIYCDWFRERILPDDSLFH